MFTGSRYVRVTQFQNELTGCLPFGEACQQLWLVPPDDVYQRLF
jgi:hypothetical protein